MPDLKGTVLTVEGGAKPRVRLLYGSKTYDFGSIAAGAEESTTVTVTGAALGDFALASIDVAGGFPSTLGVTAQVTAADTVTVTATNLSAGAVDIGSGTLAALAIKVK